MVMALFFVALIFVFLCLSEYLWRAKRISGEASRKFVHIGIGSFVAVWPFFISFGWIQLISMAFLVVITLSRKFDIFKSIHRVKRRTWGDVFFALSIGLLPLITGSRLVFMIAVLHMSLADGLAGLVGTKFGNSTRFKMFGHVKSVVGSLAFAAVSYVLVLGYFKASPFATSADINTLVLVVPVFATLLETASVKGSDNIFVPLLVAYVLNSAVA